jgi:hypothetical protein
MRPSHVFCGAARRLPVWMVSQGRHAPAHATPPLSRCTPEVWRLPEEAEVVGRVVGVVTRLNEPWSILPEEAPAVRGDSNRKVP